MGPSSGPTIGIVTPTLDAERYLEESLHSIWSQGIDLEHIVVDGGSTDLTLTIVSRYPSKVIAGRDGGMYEAINRGVSELTSDIGGYVNADDVLLPGALRTVLSAFEQHPDAQWLMGGMRYIDAGGQTLGHVVPVRLTPKALAGLGWSCVPQPATWFRRSFFDRVGPFDASFRNTGDYDWFLRAVALAKPLIVRRHLAAFRLHDRNLSLDARRMRTESLRVQRAHGGTGPAAYVAGRLLSARLNARNPRLFLAKKTGRIRFG